jgi:uncharacterized damage-inducible protein DinB
MHSAIELIRRLHAHRRWVRDRLVQVAGGLSDEALRRPFEMGPGSLFMNLAHCYGADYVWIASIEGTDFSQAFVGHAEIPSLEELMRRWAEIDARWDRFLAGLEREDLGRPIVRVRDGISYTTDLADILIHVCTHLMYHAAQMKNMMRHLGAKDLPMTDYIVFGRERWNASHGS